MTIALCDEVVVSRVSFTNSPPPGCASYASSKLSVFLNFSVTAFAVRIEHELRVVESHSPLGSILALYFITVQLAGSDAAHFHVPDEFVAILELDDVGRLIVRFVEQ